MVRRPTEPIVKGKDVNDFIKASAIPTGTETPLAQKMAIFKSKGYAKVTIEIKAFSEKDMETKLIDSFNIHLTPEKLSDDTKILQNHMNNFIPQIGKLIEAWLKEMKP